MNRLVAQLAGLLAAGVAEDTTQDRCPVFLTMKEVGNRIYQLNGSDGLRTAMENCNHCGSSSSAAILRSAWRHLPGGGDA